MLVTNVILALVAVTTPALAVNEHCAFYYGSQLQTGVCTTTSDCNGNGGNTFPGHCPGGTNNLCCIRPGCHWTQNNRCGGGSLVKYVDDLGGCYHVLLGRCPGPELFRWVTTKYRRRGVDGGEEEE
ncbi:uncharacterized protein EHS24_007032 [Apiotrichum porosum]|uniref:Uncharacterized protein n=1 Tax=Apiotrichum porosum TaxID=105984 RepID=A0A427XWX8_9TREE|nr:uncharacterized protein EHS24_007032 [Apiotrichum porosum]RSH83354.1 hypothetical protein EHS24_007032 [Apiotrichum porosum]